MVKYKLVVLTRPAPGREKELSTWYKNVHLQRMVACEGVRSGQCFTLARQISGVPLYFNLAIYEIVTSNLRHTLAEIKELEAPAEVEEADAMEERIYSALFSELGDALVTQ